MKHFLPLLIMVYATQYAVAKTTIRIIAPISASSGEKVPMGVAISPSLKAGDEMSFLFNNNLIATMSTDGKFKYNKFKTNVKMTESGYLSVRIQRKNGTRISKQKYVKVKKPAKKIKRNPNAHNGKVAVKGKTLKSVVNGYANQILIKTKSGSLLFKPTQYIAKRIFFSVTGNNNYTNAVIKIPSKTITLSPYPRTYNPQADKIAAGLLFAGLKWIYGGGSHSSSSSSSTRTSGSKNFSCHYYCRTDGLLDNHTSTFNVNIYANSRYQAEDKLGDIAKKHCQNMKASGKWMWATSKRCD